MKAVEAELGSEGAYVTVARLCAWFALPWRSFYYQPTPRRQPLGPGADRALPGLRLSVVGAAFRNQWIFDGSVPGRSRMHSRDGIAPPLTRAQPSC